MKFTITNQWSGAAIFEAEIGAAVKVARARTRYWRLLAQTDEGSVL